MHRSNLLIILNNLKFLTIYIILSLIIVIAKVKPSHATTETLKFTNIYLRFDNFSKYVFSHIYVVGEYRYLQKKIFGLEEHLR
jgi:hypothetical protein